MNPACRSCIFHSPLSIILALFLLSTCSDGNKPEINGMWQLKTIRDENNKHTQYFDTIFYAFQRQSIFSYTQLHEREGEAATSTIIYGYIDFPDNDHLHILPDKGYNNSIQLLPWNWGKENPYNEATHDIVQLDSKNLVLYYDNRTYSFIKY
jgi:hypothetical protein